MKMILLVGLPGSGKSTYVDTYVDESVERVNQDVLKSRQACEAKAIYSLSVGRDVVIDRTNVSKAQRKVWIDIAKRYGAKVEVVYFDTPISVCVDRIVKRLNHPTIDTKDEFTASAIVGRHKMDFQYPSYGEGIDTITTKQEPYVQSG